MKALLVYQWENTSTQWKKVSPFLFWYLIRFLLNAFGTLGKKDWLCCFYTAGLLGYASVYGELPEFDSRRNQTQNSLPSLPSERPWETIFSGPSHKLPPLTRLCPLFMESLLPRRSTTPVWASAPWMTLQSDIEHSHSLWETATFLSPRSIIRLWMQFYGMPFTYISAQSKQRHSCCTNKWK